MSAHKKRRQVLCLSLMAAAVAGATGCDDPFALKATQETETDTLVVYSMSGTSPAFPAGFSVGTGAIARVQTDMAFDVAFDLTTGNQVRVIPARLISATKVSFGSIQPTQQVGVLTPGGAFDAITEAPSTGFKLDSVAVVGVNEPVLVQVASDVCAYSLASLVYAKLVVDSVNSGTRQIHFRTVRNPNCGFRSFKPGVPDK